MCDTGKAGSVGWRHSKVKQASKQKEHPWPSEVGRSGELKLYQIMLLQEALAMSIYCIFV